MAALSFHCESSVSMAAPSFHCESSVSMAALSVGQLPWHLVAFTASSVSMTALSVTLPLTLCVNYTCTAINTLE